MVWTAATGTVVKSTKPAPEFAAPGNGATRRPSIKTSEAPGSKPRSEIEAVPVGPPWPDLLIKSRLRLNTGFAPTSSAVGMFEPVTITRSTSAAPGAGAGAAPGGGGGGGGF